MPSLSPIQDKPARAGISGALVRLFFRPARVTGITELAPGFRLIALEGPALRDLAWEPGQKLQVAVGERMCWRTYTPITWDRQHGRTTLLGYAHGEGPGSRWVANLRPGDSCGLFGPRRSLDLSGLSGRTILCGDETSFALASSLQQAGHRFAGIFEVVNPTDATAVLEKLAIDQVRIAARSTNEAHLDDFTRDVLALAAVEPGTILLTGRAPAIQHLSRALKAAGLDARLKAKAYWSPGKTGLD